MHLDVQRTLLDIGAMKAARHGGVWGFWHELGHNFSTPHTHNYCPVPIDQCAPAGFFGDCQTGEVCTTSGTIMSYCHACPGGLSNYTTWFHPIVADVMRAQAEIGCHIIEQAGIAFSFSQPVTDIKPVKFPIEPVILIQLIQPQSTAA